MKSINRKIISTVSAFILTFSGVSLLPQQVFDYMLKIGNNPHTYASTNKTNKINLKKCSVKLSTSTYIYNAKSQKPAVKVYHGSKKLKSGKDYSVKYKNNKKVGKARILISGKGKYTGQIAKSFKIQATQTCKSVKAKPTSKAITVSWSKAAKTNGYILQKYSSGKYVTVYKGKKLSFTDKKVKSGKQYRYRVGTYRKIGKTTYYYYSAPIKVNAYNLISIDKCNINLSNGTRIYNGKPQQPAVYITYNGKKLAQSKDYKLKYSNQINPGAAWVTITGTGNFKGEIKQFYSIVPFGEIKTPAASCTNNSISLKWCSVKNAQGYDIEVCTGNSNKFKKVATTKNTNYTLNNLSKNSTYKLRILPYFKLSGKTHYGYSHYVEKTTLSYSVDSNTRKFIQEVLNLVNIQRANNGLNKLVFDEELNNSALIRAKEVARNIANRDNKELIWDDHYYSDRKTYDKIAVYYVLEDRNFDWFKNSDNFNLGENLAKGQSTPEKVVEDWMNSPKHKANILGKNYLRTGIAYYTENNVTYWVQVFAT